MNELKMGALVRVMDDNGSAGWTGRVVEVQSDAVAVYYADFTEVFGLPDGRRGSRYICLEQEEQA